MRLAVLLVQLTDEVKQTVRRLGDELGLSVAQMDVMRRLMANGPTPMSRLADLLHCEASNLTGLVDKLEARQLVERQADPSDRRVRVLALTEDGEKLTHEAWFAVARLCPCMQLSAEERDQLTRLISKVL